MANHKFYVPTSKDNEFIRFTITFNKELTHWATGQSKEKGYCVTAVPVKRSGMFEESGAFTGFYEIVYPIERQSSKRLQTAISIVNNRMNKYKEFFTNKGYIFNN